MSDSRTVRTRAIVLRRTNYQEADRILTFLTPRGVFSALARGVRKEKSRLAGGIELFAIVDVTLHKGKGTMYTLTSARLEVFFENILQNYDQMMWLYEAMKNISQACSDTEDEAWFLVLEQLYRASHQGVSSVIIQSWFYVQYAQLTGYALSLDRDCDGGVITADASYVYDVVQKGLRRVSEGTIMADHIKLLRIMSSQSLDVVRHIGGVDVAAPECLYVSRLHAGVR